MKRLLLLLTLVLMLVSGLERPSASYIPSVVLVSVQRNTIAVLGCCSGNTVITSVNLAASRVRLLGFSSADTGSTRASIFVRLELTDATHVTAYVNSNALSTITVSFEVLTYNPAFVKNIQRSTIVLSGAATNTSPLTTVVVGKSELDYLGFSTADTNNNQTLPRLTLTDANTVTADINTAGSNVTVGYQVMEWK